MTGTIIKALSGFYYVSCDSVTYECKARGSFRKSGVSPLVGDSVEFEKCGDKGGIITEVSDRRSCLDRPPVANIDKLFIVSSYSAPAPNTLLIDKMTVKAEYSGIEPIIVFNKCDTGDFSKWKRIYENAGFKTYVISALGGDGIMSLKEELKGCISAFTGNSGVGKSSILNWLLGDDIIPTGEVSEKLGRGRHTTRHTQLYELPFGGFVADTPGFSVLELDTSDYSLKENLASYFRDILPFSADCRFSSCTHTKESDCSVRSAVENKKIEPSRYSSYIEIFEQIKDLKPWEVKKRK